MIHLATMQPKSTIYSNYTDTPFKNTNTNNLIWVKNRKILTTFNTEKGFSHIQTTLN